MRLLAIEQTRSPQGKLRLRFDSGEAMLVLPAVVADLSLRPGMDIPDAARASLEAAAGSASAKERAVRILSAATVSRAELEHRLRQKGESPENARQALAELPEQDDAIDAFLQKRFRGRQPDRTEIRRAADALLRRGHAWGDIRRALERYDPDFPEE